MPSQVRQKEPISVSTELQVWPKNNKRCFNVGVTLQSLLVPLFSTQPSYCSLQVSACVHRIANNFSRPVLPYFCKRYFGHEATIRFGVESCKSTTVRFAMFQVPSILPQSCELQKRDRNLLRYSSVKFLQKGTFRVQALIASIHTIKPAAAFHNLECGPATYSAPNLGSGVMGFVSNFVGIFNVKPKKTEIAPKILFRTI